MKMETIAELEKYLEEECYSFMELSIGKHYAPEGIVIEHEADKFNFTYSERGKKVVMKSFLCEKDLVDYALEKLSKDEWSRAHLVAWVWDESEVRDAENELRNMKIDFRRNDVPNYFKGRCAFRIFVFGKDVLRLGDFKKRFLRNMN